MANRENERQKKILVVEDVELNRHLVLQILSGWDFQVNMAANGKEALEILNNEFFDLILMDIQMPEMDGVEATRCIRSLEPPVNAIPIIALTANTMKDDTDKYFQAGMNGCISKPFKDEELYNIISKTLHGDQMITNAFKQTDNSHNPGAAVIYDLTLINSISGGDNEFTVRMVRLFLDTMPAMLQQLNDFSQTHAWQQLGDLAHKMKSTIDSMGIKSLKNEIRQLEKYGKSAEHLTEIPVLVSIVNSVMRRCMDTIKKDFSL
jgi:CheY-like chemotaxis protein